MDTRTLASVQIVDAFHGDPLRRYGVRFLARDGSGTESVLSEADNLTMDEARRVRMLPESAAGYQD